MQLSAHQANVIVKLHERTKLNKELFQEFIQNGIESCTKMNEKDKSEEFKKKLKHPGLLAAILCKLISKDSTFVSNILAELMKKVFFVEVKNEKINAFCIEFGQTPEVGQLDRLIKGKMQKQKK